MDITSADEKIITGRGSRGSNGKVKQKSTTLRLDAEGRGKLSSEGWKDGGRERKKGRTDRITRFPSWGDLMRELRAY